METYIYHWENDDRADPDVPYTEFWIGFEYTVVDDYVELGKRSLTKAVTYVDGFPAKVELSYELEEKALARFDRCTGEATQKEISEACRERWERIQEAEYEAEMEAQAEARMGR